MKELTERQKKIRRLVVDQNLTHEEAAKKMGVSRSNISMTMKRLRDRGFLTSEKAEISARLKGKQVIFNMDGTKEELLYLFFATLSRLHFYHDVSIEELEEFSNLGFFKFHKEKEWLESEDQI